MLSGVCKFWIGEPRNGLETYARGLKSHLEVSGAQVLSWWHGVLAELLVIAGKYGEAVHQLDEGNAWVRKGEITGKSYLLRTAALIATFNNQYHESDAQFRKSIEFTLERQMLPEKCVTQFRCAECLHKRGDLAGSLEQLSEATKLFAEMDMTWWGEQAKGLRARIEGAGLSCGSRRM